MSNTHAIRRALDSVEGWTVLGDPLEAWQELDNLPPGLRARKYLRSGQGIGRAELSQTSVGLRPTSRHNPAVADHSKIPGGLDAGGAEAADQLFPLIYAELRRIARAKMAQEKPGHTLQATALVHEAWLRLGGQRFDNRAHFFGAAAEAMRRILIDSARRRAAIRHGGGAERLNLDEVEVAAPARENELLAVHEVLDAFAEHDARKAELVKLRYFVGLTIEEAAEVLGISVPTANRDWAYAKAWLFRGVRSLKSGSPTS